MDTVIKIVSFTVIFLVVIFILYYFNYFRKNNIKLKELYNTNVTMCILLFSLSLLIITFLRNDFINSEGPQESLWLSFLGSLRFLFTDKDNRFNWIGVSAIAAVLTFWFTREHNKKRLEADIISKARIEWIQNVRTEAVDFISLVTSISEVDFREENKTNEILKLKKDNEIFKIEGLSNYESLQSYKLKIHEKANMLILYFGPKLDNDNETKSKINEGFVNLITVIDQTSSSIKVDTDEVEKEKLKNQVKNFRELIRVYNKVEWQRSIDTIKGTEVDMYFLDVSKRIIPSDSINEDYLGKVFYELLSKPNN